MKDTSQIANSLKIAEKIERARQKGWGIEAQGDLIAVRVPNAMQALYDIGNMPIKTCRSLEELVGFIEGAEMVMFWEQLHARANAKNTAETDKT